MKGSVRTPVTSSCGGILAFYAACTETFYPSKLPPSFHPSIFTQVSCPAPQKSHCDLIKFFNSDFPLIHLAFAIFVLDPL
ncbi:hypothetical protein RRG08_020580 [Elysia crispata]|uniref:Uncharacterized protein n=1 Tax=Elysia crispata TaxID=231223 RepID=A0AAE1DT21_9GAST|nr:hypothetical protein RRG08_020580 [Elysia crispata]